MQPHANLVTASGDGCGRAMAIRRAVPQGDEDQAGEAIAAGDPTKPYPPSRAPFVGEVPTWGGGVLVGAPAVAATAQPAAATVTGNGLIVVDTFYLSEFVSHESALVVFYSPVLSNFSFEDGFGAKHRHYFGTRNYLPYLTRELPVHFAFPSTLPIWPFRGRLCFAERDRLR